MNESSCVPNWVVLMVRGVIAAVLALTLTFLADHSATVGFLSVGIFCILSGAVVGVATIRSPESTRTSAVALAAVLIIGGIAHLALISAPVSVLMFATSAVFAASGAIELVRGIRTSDRDQIFVGAAGALLAVVALLTPADYALTYVVNEDARTMTASVILVGALGIYAAIVAVYLVIAALSMKWASGIPTPTSGSTA